MGNYFFDSSGLVKRYNSEIGTAGVLQIFRRSPKHQIYIAQMSIIEVTSALTRRLKGNAYYERTLKRFERDVKNRLNVFKMNDRILNESVRLAKIHRLRAYDSVQLATALKLEKELILFGYPSLTFVSADVELNSAAQGEGLAIENPNNYP